MANLCNKIVLILIIFSLFFSLLRASSPLATNDSGRSPHATMKLSAGRGGGGGGGARAGVSGGRGGARAQGGGVLGGGGGGSRNSGHSRSSKLPTVVPFHPFDGSGHHSATSHTSDSSLKTVLVAAALIAAFLSDV